MKKINVPGIFFTFRKSVISKFFISFFCLSMSQTVFGNIFINIYFLIEFFEWNSMIINIFDWGGCLRGFFFIFRLFWSTSLSLYLVDFGQMLFISFKFQLLFEKFISHNNWRACRSLIFCHYKFMHLKRNLDHYFLKKVIKKVKLNGKHLFDFKMNWKILFL